jgi:hypothetical protein
MRFTRRLRPGTVASFSQAGRPAVTTALPTLALPFELSMGEDLLIP